MSFLGKSSRYLLLAAVVAVLMFSVSLAVLSLLGYVRIVVLAGRSMEPTLPMGSLAVFLRDGAYSTGTIILFRVHGCLVAHRIMSEVEGGFKTKGDNCASIDPWTVPRGAALGRLLFSIPHLGSLLMALRSPPIFAAIATAVFAVLTRSALLQCGDGPA